VSLIDGATTSLDCALYSLNINAVLDAIVDAHDRGVAVRFIYDAEPRPGRGGPDRQRRCHGHRQQFRQQRAQGIQHNKFLIVDAADTDPANDRVWMGGMNFIDTSGNGIYAKDNAMIIADQAVARAYTLEFNEMWGSTRHDPQPGHEFPLRRVQDRQHAALLHGGRAARGGVVQPRRLRRRSRCAT
jgi:phosphatidylserine/phosphatidylglycerophosphate/cardiolipin synthase-like enzyme